ncbi:hypothetical protein ALQ52_04443 [Pseudomonas cannabina pv. alisalensis]|nr:hypothetical protein ALQ52_04443 [Pseudomonas cannabina pv. alisalensis]
MPLDGVPGQLSAVVCVALQAVGVFCNEIHVQHAWQAFPLRHVIRFDDRFADALQRNHVAADSHLMILRADLHAAATEHVARVLRRGKAHQRFFAQRVERDDAGAPACGGMQLGHHARAVGPGVLADDENRVGVFEILQRRGALADPDRLGQRHAGGLVAHVRAVREIGHAVHPAKQLIQERCFVRGAPGGVQLQLPWVAQMAQLLTDLGESLIPGDGQVFVAGRVIAHRFGDAALVFQVVIAPRRQLADGVLGEELGRDAFFGRLPGQRLGTVFTVFEGVRLLRVWPGTAGAVEAVGLVHGQQGAVALEQNVLMQQMFVDCVQCGPAASGRAVGL